MIKLIVGLGNPGQQYERTRHNVGFLFVDYLAAARNSRWSFSGQFQGDLAELDFAGSKLILLRPMTFMNNSGLAVAKVLRYYKIAIEELLVIHDELELADDIVRLKRGGGHAGHNGLRGIIAHLNDKEFYRLRIGIGRPESGKSVADYVLSAPSKQVQSGWQNLFADLDAGFAGLVAADAGLIEKISKSK